MYGKEIVQQEAKVEKMKADGKDEYDIRKQEEVLSESRMMIPDCVRRLGTAWDTLTGILATEADLSESEEYKAAQEVLADSKEAAKR